MKLFKKKENFVHVFFFGLTFEKETYKATQMTRIECGCVHLWRILIAKAMQQSEKAKSFFFFGQKSASFPQIFQSCLFL
jgi:hypothetical protein